MTAETDGIVTAYFEWLDDPDSLLGYEEIRSICEKVESSSGAARVHQLAELHDAKEGVVARLTEGFVKHGYEWSVANGVDDVVLRQFGVPESLLAEAGIVRRERRNKRKAAVVSAIPPRKPFSLRTLITASGASHMTVKAVIAEMVQDGRVELLGPDPARTGPGRPPNLYRRAKGSFGGERNASKKRSSSARSPRM